MGTRAENEDAGKRAERARRAKKAYRSPRLVSYGDLRRLTMAKGGAKADTTPPGGSTKA